MYVLVRKLRLIKVILCTVRERLRKGLFKLLYALFKKGLFKLLYALFRKGLAYAL